MRYRIGHLEIRSENAAKPTTLAGKWMLDWIKGLSRNSKALDIGCGKLRYTIPLAKRLSSVTAVDSSIQLERTQKLAGRMCSVREYAARSLPNVRLRNVDDPDWQFQGYQVILCSNVVSAIPCKKTRDQLIDAAFRCLRPGGRFLVTTQFRNSHFTNWQKNPKAKRFLDGYLVEGTRGTSFYGIIDAAELRRLCKRAGFTVIRSGHVKELAFVIATQ